eukprot:TRINITY_DN16703_c0_g1_i1.p1 TRINITY_DN16703_c0_g1~~TRINITY_DN16703_c0_g1_i1.p1  ORF type:complete len:574 (+),score=142.11 TRINITY_DN16703_c0_g1_i1:84-1805(+)
MAAVPARHSSGSMPVSTPATARLISPSPLQQPGSRLASPERPPRHIALSSPMLTSARSSAAPSVPGTARHVPTPVSARSGMPTSRFRSAWAGWNQKLAEEATSGAMVPGRAPWTGSLNLPVGHPGAMQRTASPAQQQQTAGSARVGSPVPQQMMSRAGSPSPLVSVRSGSPLMSPSVQSVRSPSQTMLTRTHSSPQQLMTVMPDGQRLMSFVRDPLVAQPAEGAVRLPTWQEPVVAAVAQPGEGVVRLPTWQNPALQRYMSLPAIPRAYSSSPERTFVNAGNDPNGPNAQIVLLKQALEFERRKRTSEVQGLRKDLEAQQEVLDDLVQVLQSVAGCKPGGSALKDIKLADNIGASVEELRTNFQAQEKQQSLQAEAVREGLILLNEGLEAFQLQRLQMTEELKAQRQALSNPSTARTSGGEKGQNLATASDLAALSDALTQRVQEKIENIELRSKEFKDAFDAAADSGGKKYLNIAADVAQLWDVFESRVRDLAQRMEALETTTRVVGSDGLPPRDISGDIVGDTGGQADEARATAAAIVTGLGGTGNVSAGGLESNSRSPSLREIQDSCSQR